MFLQIQIHKHEIQIDGVYRYPEYSEDSLLRALIIFDKVIANDVDGQRAIYLVQTPPYALTPRDPDGYHHLDQLIIASLFILQLQWTQIHW